MSTLVVRLNGGLGNQLFQYALGRKLMALGHRVLFDVYFFEQGPGLHVQRPYELDVFGLTVEPADRAQVRLARHQGSRLRAALAAVHPRLAPERPILEKADFVLDPAILAIRHDAYLDGYWQTEKYFADIAGTIREAFTFRAPMSDANADLARRIEATDAVSIHVRRGDYVAHAAAMAHFAVCGPSYYTDAIGTILERVPGARFFLFSDDIGWAREHIRTHAPITYVDRNTGTASFEDMRLMTRCRHHIIANSSFSWWGAWLNARPDKIVVAPREWLRDGLGTRDLIPKDWIQR